MRIGASSRSIISDAARAFLWLSGLGSGRASHTPLPLSSLCRGGLLFYLTLDMTLGTSGIIYFLGLELMGNCRAIMV